MEHRDQLAHVKNAFAGPLALQYFDKQRPPLNFTDFAYPESLAN